MKAKYVVFKREELEKELEKTLLPSEMLVVFRVLNNLELPDAEVIRGQDITAAPIFYHYASTLQTLAELGRSMGMELDYNYLLTAADHFMTAAEKSRIRTDLKLPD